MRTATKEAGAAEFVPRTTSLNRLAEAAAHCQGCELYQNATRTVFGRGPKQARLILVGEQPGDMEDRRGEPFVGPAGRVLDTALAAVGIAREDVYVTNAVKHFRWKSTAPGKRRIHQRPDARHITACHPWLAAEIAIVRPTVVMAMGATASQALFGNAFRLTQHRGERLAWPPEQGVFSRDQNPVEWALATIHPSAVLRGEPEQRAMLQQGLVEDLSVAKQILDETG